MIKSLLLKWVSRIGARSGRAHLRRAMRGYRLLKREGRIGQLEAVSAKLAQTSIAPSDQPFSPHIFGAALGHAELAVQQYLCIRLILYKLPPHLMAQAAMSGSKVVYPLPRSWQEILENEGFAVDRWRSSILWGGYIALLWGYGMRVAFGIMLDSCREFFVQRHRNREPYAHFESIAATNTPKVVSYGRSYDVMSWYMNWSGRNSSIASLSRRSSDLDAGYKTNDINVRSLAFPFLPLSLSALFRFAGWTIVASLLAAMDAVRGRVWHAIILNESAIAAAVRIALSDSLARDYLLNNSGWIYRPLWTYEAETLGSRILFYHYSTNSDGFERPEGYRLPHFSWFMTTWPVHLVWNAGHADFIKRFTQQAETEVVGPIWFSESDDALPVLDGVNIAVFDVQPMRPARIPVFTDDFQYYSPKTCSAFLRNVADACQQSGSHMVWKRKRNIGKEAHPLYRRTSNELSNLDHVVPISPGISAFRVISACSAVISLPFTSTALIGRDMGKPSCYYDPSGRLQPNDRAAHGIPIIQSFDRLLEWIENCVIRPNLAANIDGPL